jgi:ATP/ADP translocase
MAKFYKFCINLTKSYFGLYETNIARLKSEGFSQKFSSQLTIITGVAAIITGILLLSLGMDIHYSIRLRLALIPLIHIPLFGLVIIQKINTNKQIKKYRDGENNLIKP